MADSQVKAANICNITSSTVLRPNAGGSGTYIADNSISVHMTSDSPASGIYIFSLPEQGVIGDKYTISFVPVCVTNNVMYVVLYGTTTRISFTSGNRYTLTITATGADNTMAFYGADNVEKTIIIKDIQIEKGETATVYRPYSATGWVHSLRKLGTATEIIQSGDTIYADGTAATVSLKGNTVQNGTPSPSNPVDVNGVGVRTENLAYGRVEGVNINENGTIMRFSGYDVAIGRVDSGMVYTVNSYVVAFYTNEPTTIGSVSYDGSRIVGTVGTPTTFTAPITGYVAFRLNSGEQAMLNEGSTALPYEPYGYKIPISNGQQTTNIYLSQAQSLRKSSKLIISKNTLTFNVQRNLFRNNTALFATTTIGGNGITNRASLNSHFITLPTGANPQSESIECSGFHPSNSFSNFYYLRVAYDTIGMTDANTDEEFITALRNWLDVQYRNNTPVTLWYELPSAQTGIVNEPLMKIGDYADTLSNAASIPTTEGANTITVDTTVQPSEFTATWTGWHDSTVKKWDGSQWE